MNRYSIQITSKALDDMEGIYNYIAVQLMAPEAAIKQYNQIAEAIEKLYIFPERIKIIESEPERSMGLRSKIVNNYSVFYVIKDDLIVVLRVLYSASDICKRLLEEW